MYEAYRHSSFILGTVLEILLGINPFYHPHFADEETEEQGG